MPEGRLPKGIISIKKAYIPSLPSSIYRDELTLSSRIKTHQLPLNLHQKTHEGWLIFRIMGLQIQMTYNEEILHSMADIAFGHYQALTCYWQPLLGEFHILIPIEANKTIYHAGNITRMVSIMAQEYAQFRENLLKIDVFHYLEKDSDDIFNYFFFKHSQSKQKTLLPEKLHGIIVKKQEIEKFSEEHQKTYTRYKINTYSLDFSKVNATQMLNNYLLSQFVS